MFIYSDGRILMEFTV